MDYVQASVQASFSYLLEGRFIVTWLSLDEILFGV